ncbi:MAG: hypothetical protein ACRYF3_02685 [Janthinobacterium lividum]
MTRHDGFSPQRRIAAFAAFAASPQRRNAATGHHQPRPHPHVGKASGSRRRGRERMLLAHPIHAVREKRAVEQSRVRTTL